MLLHCFHILEFCSLLLHGVSTKYFGSQLLNRKNHHCHCISQFSEINMNLTCYRNYYWLLLMEEEEELYSLTLWTGQAGMWGGGCTPAAGRSGWRSWPVQHSTGAPEGAGVVPLPPCWWHQRTKELAIYTSMQDFDIQNMNRPSCGDGFVNPTSHITYIY